MVVAPTSSLGSGRLEKSALVEASQAALRSWGPDRGLASLAETPAEGDNAVPKLQVLLVVHELVAVAFLELRQLLFGRGARVR